VSQYSITPATGALMRCRRYKRQLSVRWREVVSGERPRFIARRSESKVKTGTDRSVRPHEPCHAGSTHNHLYVALQDQIAPAS